MFYMHLDYYSELSDSARRESVCAEYLLTMPEDETVDDWFAAEQLEVWL
jgi:hypothetical protein